MCGGHEVYPGSLGLNSVDFFGLSAMSAGITKLPENRELGDWYQEESQKRVGDTSQCGVLTAIIKASRPLTQAQKNLTLGKRGTLVVNIERQRPTNSEFIALLADNFRVMGLAS